MAYEPIWITQHELDQELPDWTKKNLEFKRYAIRAIQTAEIYVKTHLIKYGKYPDTPEDWNETLNVIVTKLSIYELYANKEQEAQAEDKREDAIAMLKALLEGGIAGGGESSGDGKGSPTIYVEKGSDEWNGFK